MESIRTGLLAPSREARESAADRARLLAKRDPAGVDALFSDLDLRGRCLLARALGAAGHGHAAQVALKHAADPEPEVFRAVLAGLVEGGRKSLFTELPEGMPERRRKAVEELRVQWRVEEELVRLKSDSGQTGHYLGQYTRMQELVPDALDVLFDIVRDRRRPLLGEGGAGPYESIDPEMVRFGKGELRTLAAYSFGELVPKDDDRMRARLRDLWKRYFLLDPDRDSLEKSLAAALCFSLHDLGDKQPGLEYLNELRRNQRSLDWQRRANAQWELGYAYMRLGYAEDGIRHYEDLLAEPNAPSRGVTAYNLACAFSMRAMQEPRMRKVFKQRAIQYLQRAVFEYNWIEWPWMEEDGDLDFIRDEPGYQRLLAHLKKEYPARPKREVSKRADEFLAPPK